MAEKSTGTILDWFRNEVNIDFRGWQTVRDQFNFLVQLLVYDEFIKAQFTPTPGVYQVRLTAKGRDYAKYL